jgi:mRNA-degrading endonuclease RelE of RelBE toxin-antitoxin system
VSDPRWTVELTRSAVRDLRRLDLDPPIRERVSEALRTLAEDPERPGSLKKLTNAPSGGCELVIGVCCCS